MLNFRKLLYRPQVDDWSPLAKFFFADEALNAVASELDAFDSRRHPVRCQQLMARLRACQDRVLGIIEEMLCDLFPDGGERAPRDYRVKFPDDVLHDSFSGQLWFAAECLAAGSNIVDREFESDALRPLAKTLSRHVDELRDMLKLQSLKNPAVYPQKLKHALLIFDHLFAEFELNYVSTMVPVKTAREYELLLEMTVLFSETLMRAIAKGFITVDQVEACDPIIMFSLPRLAIVCGLIVYPQGPLDMDRPVSNLCDMLLPFRSLLQKIRVFLTLLDDKELTILENKLSSTMDNDFSADEVSLFSEFRLNKDKEKLIEQCPEPNSTSSDDIHTATAYDSSELVQPETVAHTSSSSTAVGDAADENGKNANIQCRRANYRSMNDLIHRLFVCIAGVADQWQTTYPSDLRTILKMILHADSNEGSDLVAKVFEEVGQVARVPGRAEETGIDATEPHQLPVVSWVPDEECNSCTGCQVRFSFVRRRHHCRLCGNIFCARCTTNFTPLPNLGYKKPVRVCDHCFQCSSSSSSSSEAVAV